MVAVRLPSPKEAQKLRLPKLLFNDSERKLSEYATSLTDGLFDCDSTKTVVAFISKMMSVPRTSLPTARRTQLTAEQLRERRRLQKQMEVLALEEPVVVRETPKPEEASDSLCESQAMSPCAEDSVFVGFARIFSGTIRKGARVLVLGPRYDSRFPDQYCEKVTVEHLFLMMGRELEELEQVPAGNLFAIGGLGESVLKTATLAESPQCPSFSRLPFHVRL